MCSMMTARRAFETKPTPNVVKETLSEEEEEKENKEEEEDESFDLSCLFGTIVLRPSSFTGAVASRSTLITAQHQDESLQPLLEKARNQTGDSGPITSYFFKGVLC